MGARIEPQMRVSRATSPCPLLARPHRAQVRGRSSTRTSVGSALAQVRLDEPPLQLEQATVVGVEASVASSSSRDGQVVAAPGAGPGVLRHRQAWQSRRQRPGRRSARPSVER